MHVEVKISGSVDQPRPFPAPDDVVVLRGLRTNPRQPNSARVPPKIGRVVRELAGGSWLVRLYQGNALGRGRGFCRRPRAVERVNIVRLATPRERTPGAVVDHVTERAA